MKPGRAGSPAGSNYLAACVGARTVIPGRAWNRFLEVGTQYGCQRFRGFRAMIGRRPLHYWHVVPLHPSTGFGGAHGNVRFTESTLV